MNPPFPTKNKDVSRSIGDLISELTGSLRSTLRGDFNLAKAEIGQTGVQVARDVMKAGLFLVLALLGVLPLISFLILGLGRLLKDNYWISSLIVGLIFTVTGGVLLWRTLQRLKKQDLSFTRTRESLDRQLEIIENIKNNRRSA